MSSGSCAAVECLGLTISISLTVAVCMLGGFLIHSHSRALQGMYVVFLGSAFACAGERLGLAITIPLAVAVYDLIVYSSLTKSNQISHLNVP